MVESKQLTSGAEAHAVQNGGSALVNLPTFRRLPKRLLVRGDWLRAHDFRTSEGEPPLTLTLSPGERGQRGETVLFGWWLGMGLRFVIRLFLKSGAEAHALQNAVQSFRVGRVLGGRWFRMVFWCWKRWRFNGDGGPVSVGRISWPANPSRDLGCDTAVESCRQSAPNGVFVISLVAC